MVIFAPSRVSAPYPSPRFCQRDKIGDKRRYRCVDRQSRPPAGQKNLRVRVVIKNGRELVRDNAVGVKRLQVSITARQRNIPTGFWDASQHTQLPYTRRLTIDVHAAYAPAAHSDHLPLLALLADDHLARHAPGLLGPTERPV